MPGKNRRARTSLAGVFLAMALVGPAHGNIVPDPAGPCDFDQECDRCRHESYSGLCITVCHDGWDDDSSDGQYCELECVTNLASPLLDECPDTQPLACTVGSEGGSAAGALLIAALACSVWRRR